MKGNLEIEDDSRAVIVVDTFGFYRDGQITVKMKDFVVMVDGVEQLVQGNEIGLMVTNDVAQSQLLYTQHDPVRPPIRCSSAARPMQFSRHAPPRSMP